MLFTQSAMRLFFQDENIDSTKLVQYFYDIMNVQALMIIYIEEKVYGLFCELHHSLTIAPQNFNTK